MTRSNVSANAICGRRRLANALAVAGALVCWTAATPAAAEPGFPNRTVRIFVPYGPGGVGDLTMRLLAQKLGERMGKQVIIENRPGAGGVLAAKATLDSPPDGYTMLVTGNGTAISMSLFKVRPYDVLTDFTQVSVAASFEMLIATPADSPYKTVQDIIKAARANPGKLNLGAINPGSTQNLSAHLFKQTHRHRRHHRHLPDHAGPDHRADPRGRRRRLRLLCRLAVRHRRQQDPHRRVVRRGAQPAAAERADREGKRPSRLRGDELERALRSRRPARRLLAILNREINAALADPDLQVKAKQFGMNARGSTPEEMRARMARDIERWAGVIEKAGIAKQ